MSSTMKTCDEIWKQDKKENKLKGVFITEMHNILAYVCVFFCLYWKSLDLH